MKRIVKLAVISLGVMPVYASAQISLYIPTQLDHFDINGISGGGPFIGQVLSGTGQNQQVLATEVLYCDSVPQEFNIGQTFNVNIQTLNSNTSGGLSSLDPWVISQASAQALAFNTANSMTLSQKQITSAIQGVIWSLDGQLQSGPITSSDAGTAQFANYLLGKAQSVSDYSVTGYVRFDAGINYSDPLNPSGVHGQSQIGAAPVPEPSSFLAIGVPLAGLAFRRRRSAK